MEKRFAVVLLVLALAMGLCFWAYCADSQAGTLSVGMDTSTCITYSGDDNTLYIDVSAFQRYMKAKEKPTVVVRP